MRIDNPVTAIGIDPSLNSTGLATLVFSASKGEVYNHYTSAVTHPAVLTRTQKLDRLYAAIYALAKNEKPAAICIEDYAYGARNGREISGEVRGVIHLALLHAKAPDPILVSPSALKLFATGKGQADKSMMRLGVYKRWGYEAPTDDEIDAFVLSHVAMAVAWPPAQDALAGYQIDALAKITGMKKKRGKKN